MHERENPHPLGESTQVDAKIPPVGPGLIRLIMSKETERGIDYETFQKLNVALRGNRRSRRQAEAFCRAKGIRIVRGRPDDDPALHMTPKQY